MALCHSNTLIPLTNTKKKSIENSLPFFLLVCSLSCRLNGDALCSGRNGSHWETWAGHDREAFPYWTILNHGCRSDMETKAHRPLVEWGLKCLALRYGRPGLCVWPQSTSLFTAVWERAKAFFSSEAELKHDKRRPLSAQQFAESGLQW